MLYKECNIAEWEITAYMYVTCNVRVTLVVTFSYITVSFRLHYCDSCAFSQTVVTFPVLLKVSLILLSVGGAN